MANGYNTKQRGEIMDLLREVEHVTAHEVFTELRRRGSKVGASTVYRYLDRLAGEGKVRKFFIDNITAACYQLVEECAAKPHYHLKCTECGKLIHLDCEAIDEVGIHVKKEHDFDIDIAKTVFYGRCRDCKM